MNEMNFGKDRMNSLRNIIGKQFNDTLTLDNFTHLLDVHKDRFKSIPLEEKFTQAENRILSSLKNSF
ncbi:MAG: hypothetical protein ACJASQ_004306 [Crocinitomicaceae bacterium]|jgi:hypothetical protein